MGDHERAVGWMVASATAFAFMGVFVKMAPEVPVAEKVLFRNLVVLLVAGAVAIRRGMPLLGRRGNRRFLIARALLGIAGVACYFYGIDHLYLADAAMLNKLSPFVVALLGAAFLGEPLRRPVVIACVTAFTGALLVVRPRFDMTVVPALVALASAVFAGSAYALLRFMRNREAAETIVFMFALITVLVVGPVVAVDPYALTLPELGSLLGIGLAAAVGQIGLTTAYRYGPAGEVAVYSYLTILLSAVFGAVLFDEIPGLLSMLGGLLIIAGGVIVYRARSP